MKDRLWAIWAWGLCIVLAVLVTTGGLSARADDFLFPVAAGDGGGDPQNWLVCGDEAMKFALYDNAADYYSRYLDALPDNASDERFITGLVKLATAFVEGARFDDAEKILNQVDMSKVTEDKALCDQIRLLQAKILFQQRKLDACRTCLEPVFNDAAPEAVMTEAGVLMADTFVVEENWGKVAECLKKVIDHGRTESLDFQIYERLVNAYVAMERFQDASVFLREIFGKVAPENITRYQMLCVKAFAGNNEFGPALDMWGQVKAGCPEKPSPEWWQMTWLLASHLAEAGRFGQALDFLPLAYNLADEAKNKVNCLILTAECNEKSGRFDNAVQTYSILVANFPNAPEVIPVSIRLAKLKRQLGNLDEAVALFVGTADNERATLEEKFECYVEAAQCRKAQGMLEAAVEMYVRAVGSGADNHRKASALIWAAQTAAQASKFKRAADLYQLAADKYSNDPMTSEARIEQGRMYMKIDMLDGAQTAFETFLSQTPEHPRAEEVKIQLGIVKFKKAATADERLQAIAFLRSNAAASADEKRAVEGYSEAARAAEEMKNWTLAMEIYDELISKFPDNEDVQLAWYDCIMLKFRMGYDDNAVEQAGRFFEHAATSPLAANVCLLVGDYYVARQDFQRAREYYAKVRFPTFQSELVPIAMFETAVCAYDMRDFNFSKELLRDLLSDNEKGLYVMDNDLKGRVFMLQGDVKSRLADYAGALEAYRNAELAFDGEEGKCMALGRQAEMLLNLSESNADALNTAEACLNAILVNKSAAVTREMREIARFRLAQCCELRENLPEALKHYQAIILEYDALRDEGHQPAWRYYAESVFNAARILKLDNNVESLRLAAMFYDDLAKSGLPRSKEAAEAADLIRKNQDIGR